MRPEFFTKMETKKIIIFDLWQTLADSSVRPSALLGLLPDKNIFQEVFLETLFRSPIFLENKDFSLLMKDFLDRFGCSDEKVLKEALRLWEEMASSSYLLEGAKDLISQLRLKNYRLALLTNIDSWGYEKFPFPEFLENFEYSFLSYREGMAKPDFRCWQTIRDSFDVEYSNMVMIGDSYSNDIEAAISLGISAIQTNGTRGYKKIYDYFKLYEKT
jgi:HAD superfamily hydrolase (TIGR01549 family)